MHIQYRLFLSVITLVLALCGTSGFAEKSDETKKKRRVQVLSMSIYKDIEKIQKSMSEENYTMALDKTKTLLSKPRKLKPYDQAKILEIQTAIFISLSNFPNAIASAEKAIALDELEHSSIMQLHHRLFYLHFFSENYEPAIDHMKIWFANEPTPDAQSYFSFAQVYALTEQFELALGYAEQGFEQLKASAQQPNESWFQLLVTLNIRLQHFDRAKKILELAVEKWPQKAVYYRQLSSIYQQTQKEKMALTILSIAYENKVLTQEQDVRQLTQLYRYHNYPFKGAQIAAAAMTDKRMKHSEKNWEDTANAWLQALELKQAKSAFSQAANYSDHGKHWFRLCQLTFQDEAYSESEEFCKKAIQQGKLKKDESLSWYLLALAQYYQNKLDDAQAAFERCQSWESTKQDCLRWSQFVIQAKESATQQDERAIHDEVAVLTF